MWRFAFVLLAGCRGILGIESGVVIDGDSGSDFVVEFAVAEQTVDEGVPATIPISLSSPSTRAFSVDFVLSGTADAADFKLVTASPITVAAGQSTAEIQIEVAEDNAIEGIEHVTVTLASTTEGTIGAGSTHTMQILDNDSACYGEGNHAVCLASAPAGTITLPSTIDTDTSMLCATTQPLGWTTSLLQPPSCFVPGATIGVSNSLGVSGSRPLVLVASTSITINALLDVSSHRAGVVGPGAPSNACVVPPPIGSDSSGGGGGAGGSYTTKGGDGGDGKGGGQGGNASAATAAIPAVLRAGCDGQRGGAGDVAAGVPGRGGGVVYLVSGGSITLGSAAAINASGAAGAGGGDSSGGSGGGSGGTIRLHAATISVANGVRLVANGGGASSGADDTMDGTPGNEPSLISPTSPAAGGTGASNGGSGFAGMTAATAGQNALASSTNAGGGGGGGGGGLIVSNLALPGATLSAGLVVAP